MGGIPCSREKGAKGDYGAVVLLPCMCCAEGVDQMDMEGLL